jgi:cytochrome P450
MVRAVIAGFLDELDGRTEFDAVRDFSGPFPVDIISRMLGVPEPDRQQIRHWLDIVLTREEGEMGYGEAQHQAMVEMGTYFYELAVAKRANPADDMISRLTQVEVEGDDGEPTSLDDVEIAGFISLLGGAGAETVTKLVANAVVLFHRHPDQWQAVVADRSLIPVRWRRSCGTCRPRSTRVGGRCETSSSTARPSRRATPSSSSPARPPATSGSSISPIGSTSPARRTSRSASGTASTAASAPPSPAWRAASPSTSSPPGSRTFTVDEGRLERVHMSNVAGYASVPVSLPSA